MPFQSSIVVKSQSAGPPGPIGVSGIIPLTNSFTLPINAGDVAVTPASNSADAVLDGQSYYGLLPGNIVVKISRTGAQYSLKSLFKLSDPIAFPANTSLYVSGDLTILAIAADVTIAVTGPTVIQIEPNPLVVGAEVAATVGKIAGVIEQTATQTLFTPGETVGSPTALTAYVDMVILGLKAQAQAFDGVEVDSPDGRYWFAFRDLFGNLGFGLARNFEFVVNFLRIKDTLIEQKTNYRYLYWIVDKFENILFGLRRDGSIDMNALRVGDVSLTPRKNWKYLLSFVDNAGNNLLGLLRTGRVEVEQIEAKTFSIVRGSTELVSADGGQLSIPELRSQLLSVRNINRLPRTTTRDILDFFPLQGQSNGSGFQVNPYIAKFLRAQRHRAYMLQESNSGVNYFDVAATLKLAPLCEPIRNNGSGTQYPLNCEGVSMMWGVARALSETHLGEDFVSGWDNFSRGSQPYSVIGPGGTGNYYAKSIESLQHFVRLAAERGLKVRVPCVPIAHGEGDSLNASYDANLLSWYTAANTDYKAATGQVENIPLAINQQAAYPWDVPPLDISWRVSRDNPGKIVCVEPSWHYHCGDVAHLDEWSREIRRAIKWAQVVDIFHYQRRNWRPLEPISAAIAGSTVVVKFNVPVGPLQWDRHVTQPANLYINGASVANPWLNGRGFELLNVSNNPVTITKAEITAVDTVTLTFTGGTPTQVGLARHCPYDGSTALQAGPEYSRRGQLCDSDPHIGFDYEIINCGVTEGSNVITIANEAAALQGWYNFVNGPGLPSDCIIRTRTSESSFTLSNPWKGGTGTVPLTMWSDQRNRCVIFNLTI